MEDIDQKKIGEHENVLMKCIFGINWQLQILT